MQDAIQRLLIPYGDVEHRQANQFVKKLAWSHAPTWPYSSLLTPNGLPLEVTFSSASRKLHLTAEANYPDASLSEKWAVVQSFVAIENLFGPLQYALMSAPGQRYGVWLGFRSGRFKIYQEVTSAMAHVVEAQYHTPYEGRHELTPLMVGTDDNRQLEFYSVLVRPSFQRLHNLFSCHNVAAHLPWVVDTLGFLGSRSRSQVFEQLRLGISQRLDVITLFVAVRTLVRSDWILRQRLLSLATSLDMPMLEYEQATEGLEKTCLQKNNQTERPSIHGMLGLSVTPNAVQFSVGVSPF